MEAVHSKIELVTLKLPPGNLRFLGMHSRAVTEGYDQAKSGSLTESNSYISGDDGGGATPVPIPNTEVKSSSVEGTWRVAAWESRTLPVKKPSCKYDLREGFFVCITLRFQLIRK